MLHPDDFRYDSDITKFEPLRQTPSRAITGCLSSSPLSLLLFEASLPPLQITLTHFTLSSFEQALCLPTSFSSSGLARLGVKPRLCRPSWKAFASTHPLILPSTSPRKALFACPPSPPWNLLSFTVESTHSSPCSRSDPLSLDKERLSLTLILFPLTMWCSRQTALFFFLLAKAGLAYLPIAVFVALRPLSPFRQAQYD